MVLASPRDALYPRRKLLDNKIALRFRYCGVAPLGFASRVGSCDRPPVPVSLNFPTCSSLELHAQIASFQSTLPPPVTLPSSSSSKRKQLDSLIICEDLKLSDDNHPFPAFLGPFAEPHSAYIAPTTSEPRQSTRTASMILAPLCPPQPANAFGPKLYSVQLVCKCDISVIIARDDAETRQRAKLFAAQKGRMILRHQRTQLGRLLLTSLMAANAGAYCIQEVTPPCFPQTTPVTSLQQAPPPS
jgi:hypothetical protein